MTKEQAQECAKLLKDRYTINDVVEKTGVSRSYVAAIKKLTKLGLM